jgi:hypothetical protein
MECDWEMEIAPDAPVIDAAWSGYIDLRSNPARVTEIDETRQFHALAHALLRMNAAASPVWTAKCDVWPVETYDSDELDADLATAQTALGCYIDLLPSDQARFATLDATAEWCRRLCALLRGQHLRQCRVDVVVRRAFFTPDSTGLGITVYLTGCATTKLEAAVSLSHALAVLADSLLVMDASSRETSKYNEIIVGE